VSASCAIAGRPATSIVAAMAMAVRRKAARLDMGVPALRGGMRMLGDRAANGGEGACGRQRQFSDAVVMRNNAGAVRRGQDRTKSQEKKRPGNRRASSASMPDVVASADTASAEQV